MGYLFIQVDTAYQVNCRLKTSSGNNFFENKFGKNLFLLKLFKLNLIPSSVNAVLVEKERYFHCLFLLDDGFGARSELTITKPRSVVCQLTLTCFSVVLLLMR